MIIYITSLKSQGREWDSRRRDWCSVVTSVNAPHTNRSFMIGQISHQCKRHSSLFLWVSLPVKDKWERVIIRLLCLQQPYQWGICILPGNSILLQSKTLSDIFLPELKGHSHTSLALLPNPQWWEAKFFTPLSHNPLSSPHPTYFCK